MEVKKLQPFSGRNQCVVCRKARRRVEAQTRDYMLKFKVKYPKTNSIKGIAIASDELVFY